MLRRIVSVVVFALITSAISSPVFAQTMLPGSFQKTPEQIIAERLKIAEDKMEPAQVRATTAITMMTTGTGTANAKWLQAAIKLNIIPKTDVRYSGWKTRHTDLTLTYNMTMDLCFSTVQRIGEDTWPNCQGRYLANKLIAKDITKQMSERLLASDNCILAATDGSWTAVRIINMAFAIEDSCTRLVNEMMAVGY